MSPPADAPAPPDDEPATQTESAGTIDSKWWYLVAAVPLYYVVASVLGFLVGMAAFVFALTGSGTMMDGAWHVGPGMHTGFAVGGGLFVLGILGLVLVGLLLTLLFPVAIYYDAQAVERAGRGSPNGASDGAPRDAGGDWQPDPALYGLLGLAGIVAQPLQVPLAVYYLYKRHESQGQP
jgi:hypothetical protein